MGNSPHYQNFDLHLAGAAGAYTAAVQESLAGQTPARPMLCDVEALLALAAAVGDEACVTLGRALWRCAFGDSAVAGLWRGSLAAAGREGGLRLRLIVEAPELVALPWELLYDETLGRFLALDGRTPVVRFIRLPFAAAAWPQDRPLRLHFTGASPQGLPPLDATGEWASLEDALAGVVAAGRLKLSATTTNATLSAFLASLRDSVDIWHFAGHGDQNGLVFADRRGGAALAEAGTLGQLLPGEGVQLAVINACRAGSSGGAAASVAGALVRAEIPAVVAMQGALTDEAAATFAAAFYGAIAAGQPLDRAVTSARKEIYALGGASGACWWLPALFMRSPDGVLWQQPGGAEEMPRPDDRQPSAIGPDPAALRERYLREVWDACCNLKLTSIDSKTATGSREAAELALDAVFTDLDVFETPPRDEMMPAKSRRPGGARVERDENRLPVMAALTKHPRLVLLGDPGSGKSTLVNFVALCMAGEGLGAAEANRERLGEGWKLPALLPVRVILRDYAARGLPADKGLWQFIQDELKSMRNSGGESLAACIPALEAGLVAKNGAVLLLDGVDEVPEAQQCRVRLKEKIEQFGRDYPRCRIVVTSRPYAYGDPNAWLGGFEVRTLADFSPEQVQAFIRRWYEHVGQRDRSLGPINAGRYAAQLGAAVEQNPRLADLASRPLLLTLMASLHRWREGGSLPERRQELYEASVGLLLDLWQRPKQVFDSQGQAAGIEYDVWQELGIGAEALRKALELVAYEAHWKQPSTEGTHDIRARDLVGVLYERSDKAKTGAEADAGERRIVAYLTNRAGLLIERDQGAVYAFPHRTFQEYLAACHLAAIDFPYLLADRLREDDGRWREASLLAAARAVTGSPAPIWNLVSGFCPHDVSAAQAGSLRHIVDADWYAALRAAEALIETELHRDAPERQAYLVERLRSWLLALVEGGRLPPAERAAAGVALGRLGDPRLSGPHLLPKFIPIPGGAFWMGSDDAEVARLKTETGEERKNEWPRHQVELADFAIARYPTTNAMFRRFMEAGGYSDERWWSEAQAAKVWRPDGTVKDRWSDIRSQPAYWDDGRFNSPSQPVIGVMWYEAVAYCRWLTAALNDGAVYRLPTEAEWERAARGPQDWRYPWSDAWVEGGCNSKELGLERTTPVGIFPQGASAEGVLDLAGNVWEWCSDWYDQKAYQRRAGRVTRDPSGPASGEYRVLRGGSWYNDRNRVRCACRDGYNPALRDDGLGFRVARGSLR